jgi:AraC family transcriptional regulator, ethanolamine operon transcriptional activator
MSANLRPPADIPASAAALARSVTFCAFTDVDEQARVFKGWDLDYTQISRGAFSGSSSIASIGGVRVLVERLDKVILQRGSVPAGRIAVAVPLELDGHARMCGQVSGRDSLHVFSSVKEFEFFSPDQHVLANVEINVDQIDSEALRSFAFSLYETRMAPVMPMSEAKAQRFRDVLREVLSISVTGTQHEQAVALQGAILSALSAALESEAVGLRRTVAGNHAALVEATQRRLEIAETCPLSIAELCGQLAVSRRTIQYAFQHVLNLNPVAYLRAVRLNHVRRALRAGDSVTSAATKWGFLHLGSFAHDYRTMFGELPSDTARRCKRV